MATANMLLDLPSVSVTLGPAWATKINTALGLVDAHDHSTGKGVPVPSSGLNVDDDLPFGGNNATLLRSARFSSQSAALAVSTDLGCVYNVGGDLYWNNGNGTAVQITSGGSLSATSLGGISGLPSGTASVAFATSTYTFNSATNTRATMDVGPLVIREAAAAALGITLGSPVGLAGAYSLTLPSALPGSTMFMRLTAAGVLAADVAPDGTTLEVSGATFRVKDAGITAAKIATGVITQVKMGAVGQVLSSAATDSTSSLSFEAITGLAAASLTTTGRPIMLMVLATDGSGANGRWTIVNGATAGYHYSYLRIVVTGTVNTVIGDTTASSYMLASEQRELPFNFFGPLFYAPGAGTYSFTVQGKVDEATTSIGATNLKLVAFEI